jgi:hypothetical protein
MNWTPPFWRLLRPNVTAPTSAFFMPLSSTDTAHD